MKEALQEPEGRAVGAEQGAPEQGHSFQRKTRRQSRFHRRNRQPGSYKERRAKQSMKAALQEPGEAIASTIGGHCEELQGVWPEALCFCSSVKTKEEAITIPA